IELNDAEGEDKVAIEKRIEELEDDIKNNDEYIALYNDKLPEVEQETLATTNTTSSSSTSSTTDNNSSSIETKSALSNGVIDYSKYDNNIIKPNGEVADYSSDFSNQFSSADNIVDPLTSSKEKE